MTQQTPAGWFPQEDGTQRYWDGEAWTDHIAPGVSAQAPDERPLWQKKRFLIPVIGVPALFMVIVLASLAAALTSSSPDEPAALADESREPVATASKVAETFTMPIVTGLNLQDAQDILQSLGSYLLDQQDASGEGRAQLIDSNWKVCSQEPAAGDDVPLTATIILTAVKTDEVCPGEAAAAASPTTSPAATTPAAPAAPALTTSQEQAVRVAESYLDYTAFSRTGLIGQLEYEGFSNADAAVAIDSLGVDWYAQAAIMAQQYLDYSGFSHSGLVDQLIYEGFSAEEAEYGVTQAGL